jgi:hypothetical protein
MWPFKKKSADHALRELVDGLGQALGQKLISVVVFGSKASGEFREGRSNVNVFLLIENASGETLDLMAKPVRSWLKVGHPMPVIVPMGELQAYANNLPIEFLDMQDHRQVIFGPDPLQGLMVDRSYLRAQCAQELSVKLLKLRQAMLLVNGDMKRLREVLVGSLSSVLTLYRAALRLESEAPKASKVIAAKELARRLGGDGDYVERLWDLHMRRDTDNMEDLARHYLAAIERILAYVSKPQKSTI